MIRGPISTLPIAVATAIGIAGAAMPAQAGSAGNGTAGSGMAQFQNGMNLPLYRYEADAGRLCKGDTVVRGSSANKGIYFVKGAGPYSNTGQRIGGFYACMADAKKGGYEIGQ
jgi:hypothetical protein